MIENRSKRADQRELTNSVVKRLEATNIGQHVSELSEFLIEGLSPRGLLSLLALDLRLHVSIAQYVYLEARLPDADAASSEAGGDRRSEYLGRCCIHYE